MLDYNLCRRLKEAGFPLLRSVDVMWDGKHKKIDLNYDMFLEEPLFNLDDDTFWIPTLEELIEACKENFSALAHEINNENIEEFVAYSDWGHDHQPEGTSGHGSTPSEAVAALYISLHEKKV